MIFRRMHWPHSSAELVQTRDMLNHRYDEPNSGYAFHPAAFANLDKIRDYVAGNVWTPADGVIEEIFDTIRGLVPFLYHGHQRPNLSSRPLRFALDANT
jgi:plasmid stabilization system protein ParE